MKWVLPVFNASMTFVSTVAARVYAKLVFSLVSSRIRKGINVISVINSVRGALEIWNANCVFKMEKFLIKRETLATSAMRAIAFIASRIDYVRYANRTTLNPPWIIPSVFSVKLSDA